jgi:2-oxoglutarate ferredoxin oxidoreductase subunit gamma
VTTRIIIAGFGGQGIILTGKLLAYSAMIENKEVTHMPSYGAEMRGGTAHCSVIISDQPIASPVVSNPDISLVFNQPSKTKFESKIKNNGKILINDSLVKEKTKRDDIDAYYIDATNLADQIGNVRSANMVMLGALAKITNIVKLETIIDSLSKVISARNRSLIEINTKALKKGFDLF